MKTLKLFFLLLVITGGVYPLVVNVFAKYLFPFQAEGSLLKKDGQTIGSLLIAQNFDLPLYFHPRPSFCNFSTTPSYASNFGPTNKQLVEEVAKRKERYALDYVPSDLLFSSASGIDPHISLEAALIQVKRVAFARDIDEERIMLLIMQTKEKGLGFSSSPYVNVLKLNLLLDEELVKK